MVTNEVEIIKLRTNKKVIIKDGKCYKIFAEGTNSANVLYEATNQARVEETGLNIPKLLEVSIDEGCWMIVMQYIEGETLESKINKNPQDHTKYIKQFVDLQINMHGKRVPLLTKHHDKMNRKVAETGLSATLRYDLHNRIEAMPNYNCLCHGDYNPSNVIITKDGTAYIIDWSHATQGNPEADAARTYMLFMLDGRNDLASEYIDIFCSKSGCNYKDVLSWLPILAASQSVKGKKEQEPLLTKLIYMDDKQLEELYAQIRD